MRQDMRLGRVAGIQIGASWTVAVIVVVVAAELGERILPAVVRHQPAAVYWPVAVIAAVLFLASLLGHELSHSIVARRHGVRVRSITLWALGGISELEDDPPDPGAELRIALAGPAASLVAGAVFASAAAAVGYAGGPAVVAVAAAWLALMNVALTVFNLLPGAPLDGGRVLRALLWRHYQDRGRASATAARAGQYLGGGILASGVAELVAWRSFGGIWLMLMGWFLLGAAATEKSAASVVTLSGMRVADIMTAEPELAPGWITVRDFAGEAAAHRAQEAFPVVDFGGRLTGLVLAGQLARIPGPARGELRVDQVALAVPSQYRAAPGDPAGELLGLRPLGGVVVAVVLADDRVAGLVTAADLRMAGRRRAGARMRRLSSADREA